MALQRQLKLVEEEGPNGESIQRSALRIAFATSDLKRINQHFGSAERFALYSIDPEQVQLIEVCEFGNLNQDGNENKLLEKFVVLDGCAAVYSTAIGPSAVRQLLSLGVQPLKVNEYTTIAGQIDQLRQELREGPSGWIARAIRQQQPRAAQHFDLMEEEGWSE